MFTAIKRWQRVRELKKELKSFWLEVYKNWELFHVMDQRQVIEHQFKLDCWEKIQKLEKIQLSEATKGYGDTLRSFNEALIECRKYEKWYASDIKNKTQENAQKLHAYKMELKKCFQELQPALDNTKKYMAQRLAELGII